VLLVTVFILVLLSFWYQRKGNPIGIRKIAGLDAIDQAVGRATEMGKPVHFTTGAVATLQGGVEGAQILAGLTILSHIAGLTAKYKTPLIVTVNQPQSLPLTEQIVREAYMKAGHPEDFKENMVRHLSAEQMAYVAAVCGIFIREQVAANFMIGPLYAETLPIAETGFRVGAMQVGGAADKMLQLPMVIAVCDYALIGGEIFAAGAYISKEPDLLATILAEDITKIGLIGLFLIGTIITLFGNVFLDFLKM
jgi:hypothetical protein